MTEEESVGVMVNTARKRNFFVLMVSVCLSAYFALMGVSDASAVATQSTLTMQIVPDILTTSITPTFGGTFGKTASSTISVSTDNFTGYTLSIKSQSSTSLLNGNNDAIESLSSAISEATFSSDSTYNNKWGYQPSQYVTTSGGVNTTVPNTDYLPAPSTTGDLLAVTTAANSTAHQYTLVAAARVDTTLPADTYEYTYVLMAVANTIVYNITYDDFTTETVTNMPSPNPQALEIDGGTPVAQSYGTLSVAAPTMTSDDMFFGGWCTEQTILNTYTHNYECEGTTYQPGDTYPIDQTADGTNITLYAIWVDDFFPVVWAQTGKCVFTSTQTGTDTYQGNVSGTECAEYNGKQYIDTGIALYNNKNYQKDYEVHFTLDTFNPNAQLETQATMFNDKLSSSVTEMPYGGKSPGAVVRLTSNHAFEIKSTYGAPTDHAISRVVTKTPYTTAYNGTDVRIFRINGHIYTSVDNEPLVELQNYTSFNQQFGLTAWFGAYPNNVVCTENCTSAKRFFTGEMSNMYIKLGDLKADKLHTITFDANGGTPATTEHLIIDGDALVVLPEVTRSGWFFDGWWTEQSGGQQVSAATVPTATTTYYAHWYKSVADAQITNTSIALSLNGTETITITNASDIEPYSLASSDTSVATVDASGVITAVANGIATITMTGTNTGDTRTISVSVGSSYTVDFDSQGGSPATYQESVGDGSSFSSLPEPTYTGFEFQGWYTGTNGTGTQLTTSTVFDSSTPTQYYAYWTQTVYVCKVATTLHTDQCARTSGGCYGAGWRSTDTIEYGHLITSSSTATAGAAYDCDVDFDGTYDPDTERFYYFGTENGNAKLIYYKNMSNNASVPYVDAIALLPNYELDANNPSTPVWDNPYLVRHTSGDYQGKAARFMTYPEIRSGLYSGGNNHITPSDPVSTYLFEQSNFTVTNRTDGIWLEQQTDGQGNITYVSRIQTASRALTHGAVGETSANASRPTIEVPTQYIEPYTPTAYDITFNPHNETASWTETIDVGDDLTDVYPASNPTYTDHLFQGWWTAEDGGTQVSSSTVPSADTTYHAHWLKTVALATLASDSFSIMEGNTDTIDVTNSSDLEPYSFTSLDTSVATVDSSTGVITAVTAGTTTINMVGTTSGATKAISVDVTAAPTTYEITFDPHNGTSDWTETINIGDTLAAVYPATDPTYTNYVFQGWWTAADGGTQISSSTQPSGDTTYHAQWLKSVALATLGSNSLSVQEGDTEAVVVTNSADLEPYSFSSLDTSVATVDSSTGIVTGVAEGTTTIRMTGTSSGAYIDISVTVTEPQAISTVCRLAVAGSLHTATRVSDDAPLEYGQIASSSTPQSGDAYDCDVNNDDNYNATNERFYYLGQDGNNNAVLVAWNSYYEGAWAPGTSGDNNYNYANALPQLPSNADGEWDHPGLVEQATGKAARLMNYSEVVAACPGVSVGATQSLVTCDFLMEHSAYDGGGRSALWLNYDGSTYRRIHAGDTNRNVLTVSNANNSNNMVRPAIVVPYDLIEKYVVPQATVTFNSMGGSSVGEVTIDEGSALGTDYPSTDPTKTDNKFFGWYTDTTYTTEVTPETVVNSDVTYYARWIGDTTNFPIKWSEINECDFNGANNLSGTYCTQPTNQSYINTGIKLFSAYGFDTNDLTANFDKDFEVGFTIIEFDRTKQTNTQASVVNSKLEDTGYPGFVFRRNGGTSYQLTAKFPGAGNPTTTDPVNNPVSEGELKHVRIVKRGSKMYYAWNGGQLIEWWDITGFSTTFETEVWFGAIDDGSGSPDRRIVGKLTDMYIRVGTYEEVGTYTIQFNPNGGEITSGSSSVDINQGDRIGSFPTVTRANYTLDGWYDDNDNPVTTNTIPNRSQTYHAVWIYNSSKTPVTFDVSNAAVTGYDTIVKSYAPQITTFNEADPINNSTWGVAKATYHADLQSNFETNNCMAVPQEDSQIDWGGNHTVNCSKPSAYDTGRSGGVDVYEYDVANDTVIGTALAYTKSSGGVIYNLIPGHDYYWEDSSDNTIYGVISAVSSASDRRLLDVGNVWNVRDLGGLPVDSDGDGTVDGTIDYGKLIRGGRLNTTSSNITELQNLGVDKEYDLAGSGELSPDVQFGNGNYVNDEVIHYNFDYGTIVDNEDTYAMARQAVTDIMNDVISGNDVYFHCRVGADRTGTVAYILEGLLGVPDEHRYRDYELTSVSGLNDRTRYYAQKSSTNNKKFLFMMGYLQTTADIVAWYLADTTDTGAAARITAFKQAMIVSSGGGGGGGQQNSPQNAPAQQQVSPLSLNNTNISGTEIKSVNNGGASDSAELANEDTEAEAVASSRGGYEEPLGMFEKTVGADGDDATDDSSPAMMGAAIAAGVVVLTGAASYALTKQDGSAG